MNEVDILRNKLELRAGFLNPKSPSVYLSQTSDNSFWSFEKNFIQIGIKTVVEKAPHEVEKLSTLLLAHEVSHTLHTDPKAAKGVDFPFQIFNILEDQRIEKLIQKKEGYDFHPLHKFYHNFFYLKSTYYQTLINNPYNIGVLLRWRRWGVETKVEKPDSLADEEFKEFLSDWERAIEESENAKNTEKVVKIARKLYLKWKHVFGEEAPPNTVLGIEDGSKESFGNGEIKENPKQYDLDKPSTSNDPLKEYYNTDKPLMKSSANYKEILEPRDTDCFSNKTFFQWNKNWIQGTARELKKKLELPTYEETEYRLTGKRINPARAENFLPPFKRKETVSLSIRKHKVLIVLDGSGSMYDKPFYWASHIAKILKMFFNCHIVITTTAAKRPILIKDIEKLRYYEPNHSEGYRFLGNLPLKFDFTIFLTDAIVCREDVNYVKTLAKRTRICAGYVLEEKDNQIIDALGSAFPRYFYSSPRVVATELSILPKNMFLRKR